jgi:hypothetical protein
MIAKWSASVTRRHTSNGFTLGELLVSVFVLVIILFMVTQLMSSATSITRAGNKHIDTDTQARAVFDRIALDFAQMVKRTDVDYFVKGPASYNNHGHGNGHGWGHGLGTDQQGSDQIAFFSQVPGYNSTNSSWRSPISLVAYRVNQRNATGNPAYLRLERMGKALLWNGANNNVNGNNVYYPIVFLPQTIDGIDVWSAAVNNGNSCNGNNASCDPDYETIGPGVFRFEYYYLLKNGRVTDVPWNIDVWGTTRQSLTSPTNIGLSEIESIAVVIAVIDPAGRALINAASANSLLDLAADMSDFKTAPGRGVGGAHRIGDMEDTWKGILFGDSNRGLPGIVNTGQTSSGTPVPPEAVKAIRIYTRYFDLKTL